MTRSTLVAVASVCVVAAFFVGRCAAERPRFWYETKEPVVNFGTDRVGQQRAICELPPGFLFATEQKLDWDKDAAMLAFLPVGLQPEMRTSADRWSASASDGRPSVYGRIELRRVDHTAVNPMK